MGRRGPQKAPAKVLQLKGRGPDKDIAGRPIAPIPNFVREPPTPPEWLSGPARQQWALSVASLEGLDMLKPADRALMSVFCETWARYDAAISVVRAEGTTLLNPKTHHVYKHPALSVAEFAVRDLLKFAREFGLTPVAESRISQLGACRG